MSESYNLERHKHFYDDDELAFDENENEDEDDDELLLIDKERRSLDYMNENYDKYRARFKDLNIDDLNLVREELTNLHKRIVSEYKKLQDREIDIKKRECDYLEREIQQKQYNELEFKLRIEEIKCKYENEIDELKNEIKEKVKDNKRLQESYKQLKQANDQLKTNNVDLQEKCIKLEKQYNCLNSRFNNLLKKQEYENVKKQSNSKENVIDKELTEVPKPLSSTSSKASSNGTWNNSQITQTYETISVLLDWINESYLKNIDLNVPLSGKNIVIDNCCRILPLINYLINYSQTNITYFNCFYKFHLQYLQFIYWSLLHCDYSYSNQKINFFSLYRHIGEELYKPIKQGGLVDSKPSSNDNEDNNSEKIITMSNEDDGEIKLNLRKLYINSDDSHIRLLSSLIILRTLNQVDYLVNVFDILRNDLSDDFIKGKFLAYYGTYTLLKWCKLANKPLLNCAIDTYLQLSIDSTLLNDFLKQCSNETWFSHIAVLLRQLTIPSTNKMQTTTDYKVIEKLSILLQKLSKIKSNKKYFDMLSIQTLIQDLNQKLLNSNENSFLLLNLKSILANLQSTSTTTTNK